MIKANLALYWDFGDIASLLAALVRDPPRSLDIRLTTSSIGSSGVDPGPPGVRMDTRSVSFIGDRLDPGRKRIEPR